MNNIPKKHFNASSLKYNTFSRGGSMNNDQNSEDRIQKTSSDNCYLTSDH